MATKKVYLKHGNPQVFTPMDGLSSDEMIALLIEESKKGYPTVLVVSV